MTEGPGIEVMSWRMKHNSGLYEGADIKWQSPKGDTRRVQVTVSPTGRSVQVYVDGEPWVADHHCEELIQIPMESEECA